MSAPLRAEAIVLRWARAYTRGLPDEAAERRLGELASDCHEQRHWGREVGASPVAVATSMVARTLAGLPADLLWRSSQLATARDRSPVTEGRPMGRWIKDNWWIALAGLVGVFLVVFGIGLPLEDRTLGSWIGGGVHVALGLTMLAGIGVRRTRRKRGDVMIAVGTMAMMPWLWTIVLPVLGLLVLVPALIDLSDASAAGGDTEAGAVDDRTRPTPPAPSGPDRLLPAIVGLLTAAVVAAAVIAQPTPAVVLVAAPLSLLVAHLLMRRLNASATTRVGATLVATNFVYGPVLMLAGLIGQDSLDLGGTWGTVVNYLVGDIGVAGLGLLVAGFIASRRQARPA